MLHILVGGPLDPIAAGFALVATFGMLTVVVTTFIVKRRSSVEIANDFSLAKMRLREDRQTEENSRKRQHEFELAKLASNREIEFRRIDGNMITSHQVEREQG